MRGLILATGLFALPTIASAHAFGTQYTLPLPISFYILGGVGAFLASSLVIFLFSEPLPESNKESERVRPFIHPRRVVAIFAWIGLIAFMLELVFAFFGSTSFIFNPAVVLFWIGLLLGLAYLSVLIGGLWELLNPFKTLASWLLGERARGMYAYPAELGYLPALVFWFGLIEFEIFSGGAGSIPQMVGIRLVAYAVICIAGSVVFGLGPWFRYADGFSVFFRAISAFAPVQLTEEGIALGSPARALITETSPHLSLIFFVLFMLSSTALDGIKDTLPWGQFLLFLSSFGLPVDANLVGIIVLIASPFIFFAFYAAAVFVMRLLTHAQPSFRELLLRFGYSLVPIAIAYHFAHYFTLFLGDGQRIFYQISDPFGKGWNLFGTAGYTYNPVPLGADIIWYIQLGAIVVGHVIAAIIAHRIATRVFHTKKDVVLSQLPMLVLMVAYTAFGLWILSRAFVPG